MESEIRLNTQRTATPRINGIDVLANAKPVRMNPAPNPARDTDAEIAQIQSAKAQLQEAYNAQDIAQDSRQTRTQPSPAQPRVNPQNPRAQNPASSAANAPRQAQDSAPQARNADSGEAVLPRSKDSAHFADKSTLAVDVEKLDFAVTRRVRAYLKKLISIGGSDLHLKAGSQVRARINGDIVVFSNDIFTKDDAITFAKELTRTRFPEFARNKEMDMTYIYDTTTRFRVNIFFQMEGVSFAFRTIPTTQSTIDELRLPEAIHKIIDMERGLVLVTGITGSGKSTTLAAIINEINHKKAKHIITIEDPIEFVHKDNKSMLNQRSVGMDTNSFASALKSALREDPDIILVGEMRDIETIEMALHAAETGHLVLSTLHTLDAKETINRIISVFPTNDQPRIRATLASVLVAIISQRLLKATSGGRIAAIELLFKTPRIELIITEGRDGEIMEALQEGRGIYGTQTFDQHLFELIVNGLVEEDVAMEQATSPSDLKLRLQNVNFADKKDADTISIKEQ